MKIERFVVAAVCIMVGWATLVLLLVGIRGGEIWVQNRNAKRLRRAR